MLINVFYELFDHNRYKHKIQNQYQGPSYFNTKNHFWYKLNQDNCHKDNIEYFICKKLTEKFLNYKETNSDYDNRFYNSFDHTKYYLKNSDLKTLNHFQEKKKCWDHFQSRGWMENRIDCFNNVSFLKDYIDLRQNIIFIIYYSLFDYIKYKRDKINLDSKKNLSKRYCWDHFQNHALENPNDNYFKFSLLKLQYSERRKIHKLDFIPNQNITIDCFNLIKFLKKNFQLNDIEAYLSKDLFSPGGYLKDMKGILIENGYTVFDINCNINDEETHTVSNLEILPIFYKNMAKDLSQLDNSSLKKHYHEKGKYENYRTNKFQYFNKYFYKYANPDLTYTNYNDLYNHYCRYGYDEKRRSSIQNYNLYTIKDNGSLINEDYLNDFVFRFGFNQYEKKFNVSVVKDYNLVPILFYSDNKNFQNFFNIDDTVSDNMKFIYESFFHIFNCLTKKNWKYLIYTNERLDIKNILLSNNKIIIYNIKKVTRPYFIINNLSNDSDNYITTHLKHFIPKLTFHKIDIPILYDRNMSYVLTINDEKYKKFTERAKNIHINYKKFTGINKKVLNNLTTKRPLGHLCCLLGHYLILKNNYSGNHILIMEDDNDFVEDFNYKWSIIKSYLDKNDNDWDIFNGNLVLPAFISKCTIVNQSVNIINYTNNSKTNFIYYNKHIIPKFIHNVENILFQINYRNQNWIIDRFLNVFNLVTSVPFISREVEGNLSEIDNQISNYQSLSKRCQKQLIDIINITIYQPKIYLLVHFFNNKMLHEFVEKINNFIDINPSYDIKVIMNLVENSSCYLKDSIIKNIKNITINIIKNVSDPYSMLLMIKNLNVTDNDLIIYIHTKTNDVIRSNLMNILSIKLNDTIFNNDAFFTQKYFSSYKQSNIREAHNSYYIQEICRITGKEYVDEFLYYPITFFAYKAQFLRCIFKNVDKLISMCSFKEKICENWLKIMNNENNYKIYNVKMEQGFENNYFSSLIHKKIKGIPNGCFEHGLERFIGGILLKEVDHVYNFV